MSYFYTLIDSAGHLWDAGKDTYLISKELKIPEHQAVFLVGKHREKSRLRRARPTASPAQALA